MEGVLREVLLCWLRLMVIMKRIYRIYQQLEGQEVGQVEQVGHQKRFVAQSRQALRVVKEIRRKH